MFHGGAITGRVIDANGDPLEGVQVQAFRIPKYGGRPQPRFGGNTNDLGDFRVAHLDPGRYVLLAMPSRGFAPGGMEVRDTGPQPTPTFYPGVLSMAQAQSITVERGTTVAGIDVQLTDAEASTVSGTAVTASGQPVATGGTVIVRPLLQDLAAVGMGMTSGTSLNPDGTFQLVLTPGEYELEAHAAQTRASGPPAPGSELIGVVRVNVAGALSGITIALGATASVSGRVVFEGTVPVPGFPALNGPGMIAFTTIEGSSCRAGRSETRPDWTFTVDGVAGTCVARFSGGIPGWFLKAIRSVDGDLTDQRVTFTPGQKMRDVEVVMTDKPSELMFHVSDERGLPTRDYVGLVFSVEQSKWTENTGRYIRTLVPPPDAARSSSATRGEPVANRTFGAGTVPPSSVAAMNGDLSRREIVAAMPAGEYFAIAVEDLEADGFRDPPVLEQLSRHATRITIADGTRAEVTLRRLKVTMPQP